MSEDIPENQWDEVTSCCTPDYVCFLVLQYGGYMLLNGLFNV